MKRVLQRRGSSYPFLLLVTTTVFCRLGKMPDSKVRGKRKRMCFEILFRFWYLLVQNKFENLEKQNQEHQSKLLADALKTGHGSIPYITVQICKASLREEKCLFSLQSHLFNRQMLLYEGDLQLRCDHIARLASAASSFRQESVPQCQNANNNPRFEREILSTGT